MDRLNLVFLVDHLLGPECQLNPVLLVFLVHQILLNLVHLVCQLQLHLEILEFLYHLEYLVFLEDHRLDLVCRLNLVFPVHPVHRFHLFHLFLVFLVYLEFQIQLFLVFPVYLEFQIQLFLESLNHLEYPANPDYRRLIIPLLAELWLFVL